MFDVVQLVNRKQAGEFLIDRTLFDELESGRESGRRSKVFATLLSAFPGAGQMYLGLQKRGLHHGPISWQRFMCWMYSSCRCSCFDSVDLVLCIL